MATYDEVMAALRNADKAGNADAAQRLAGIAASMRGQNPEFSQRAAGMSPRDISIARSKNDEFGNYLRQQASQPQPGETDAEMFRRQYGGLSEAPRPGTGQGMARAGLQGATFGFGDEVVAGGTAALDALIRGDDLGQAYDARLASERQKIDMFREDSPVAAYGAEIAGAIPTSMMLPQIRAMQGGGLLARAGAGGATAGYQGFGYGFGAGDGGFADRLMNGLMTGAIAAPIGAAVPVAGAGARNLASRMMRSGAARDVGMSRPAFDIMDRAMRADDSLTGVGAARLRAAGPDAMVADAGPNAQSLLDVATQRSGPAATAARQAIDGRVTAASRNVTRALDDTLGRPAGLRETARGIAQSTAGARGDAYDAAYSVAINYADDTGRNIEGVLNRIPSRTLNQAIQEANEEMIAAGRRNLQIMASVADDGTVTFKEMPNVEQLDQIKRALQRIGYESVDTFGRPTSAGVRARNLAHDLRDVLGRAVPEYDAATRAGGDKIAMDQALDLGRKMLSPSTTREIVRDAARGMSDAERAMVGQGLRSQIDETLANVKQAMTDGNMEAREAVKALRDLSSRASREKVTAVIGDDAASRMFSKLDRATTAFELRAGVAANSKTFARTSMDETIRGQTDDGIINAVRSGEPINAGRRLIQTVLGRTPSDKMRITDETFSDLVRVLTGPRGPQALAALRRLERASAQIPQRSEAARNLTETMLRRGTTAVAPTVQYLD